MRGRSEGEGDGPGGKERCGLRARERMEYVERSEAKADHSDIAAGMALLGPPGERRQILGFAGAEGRVGVRQSAAMPPHVRDHHTEALAGQQLRHDVEISGVLAVEQSMDEEDRRPAGAWRSHEHGPSLTLHLRLYQPKAAPPGEVLTGRGFAGVGPLVSALLREIRSQ